jgi:hypothetical protein
MTSAQQSTAGTSGLMAYGVEWLDHMSASAADRELFALLRLVVLGGSCGDVVGPNLGERW